MSKIALQGNASGTGTFTIQTPATNTNRLLSIPDVSGTLITKNASNEVTDIWLKNYAKSLNNLGTISTATNIDLSLGNYHVASVNASLTLSPINISTGGRTFSLRLYMLGAYSITWNFTNLLWPNQVTPTLQSGKNHIFIFTTSDSGVNWQANCTIY